MMKSKGSLEEADNDEDGRLLSDHNMVVIIEWYD